MFQTLNEFTNQTIGVSLNVVMQVSIVLFVVGLITYTVLFTNYPAIHDYFHELRHGLYVIPCH